MLDKITRSIEQNMDRLKPVDVVIVGGGWTGLLMAKEIAIRTSLSVLVLERGAQVRRDYASTMDELDYLIRLRMMQNLSEETITHRHSVNDRAAPMRQYGAFDPGTGVGGAGEHWGAVSNRYRTEQFTLLSHLKEKYGAANLPEHHMVQDWGFTYDELEPYYWRAEQMMGVCGKAGNLNGALVEGGDPFEGPRSHEFPNPPHKMSYFPTLFRKAALDLGYHPYPIPTATLSQNYRNPDGVERPACMYCGYCSRFGCMIGAKAQPSNTLLPLLKNKTNFSLRTGCSVRRVVHRNGRAEGVTYVDPSGHEMMQPANVVMLASWTMNNPRLLMLSKIGDPYDPATGKGTLGKNLTHAVNQQVQLFFDKPLNLFMGTGGLGYAIGEFAGDPAGLDPSDGIVRGSEIRANTNGEGPISSFGKVPPGEVETNWGSQWKKSSLRWHDKVAQISCEAAHLAYRHNYIDLDPTYTDKFGDALVRLTLDWTNHEKRQKAFLAKRMVALGKAMGAKIGPVLHGTEDHYSIAYYQSTHVQGGAIMGDSPENGVVNSWLQHWRMSNLWVVGGSAFPQNESANPTLTILAVTYRAADAFVERYIKNPGALA
jgi:gluconate 2-dehydrogenase alpha chain